MAKICNFLQVVYNLAKGVSEVEKLRPWLLNIQARAPNCPVIVVGTHLDNIPKGWLDHEKIYRQTMKAFRHGGHSYPRQREETQGTLIENSANIGPL